MSDPDISLTPAGNGSNRTSRSNAGNGTASSSSSSTESSGEPSGAGSSQNGGKAVEKDKISQEKLEKSTELLNKSAEILQRDIRFNVVPSEDIVQAQIVNRESEEVIKEIPPDEIIEMRKKIDAFIGLFVDESR